MKIFNLLKDYIWNVLKAVDQLANAILLGDPDETISSRMGKALPRCKLCRFICKLIHPIDKKHCRKAIESDEGNDELWKW